jgi:hypothetical protein
MDTITLTIPDIDLITELFFIYSFIGVLFALFAYDLLSFGLSSFVIRIKRKRMQSLKISDN